MAVLLMGITLELLLTCYKNGLLTSLCTCPFIYIKCKQRPKSGGQPLDFQRIGGLEVSAGFNPPLTRGTWAL